MSFTLASVSAQGARLNPLQRTEGPLFFCHLPAMVDPQVVIHSDWNTHTDGLAVHIIYAYITLLPPQQRRNALIKRDREDRAVVAQKTHPVILTPTGNTGATPKKQSRPNPPTSSGTNTRPNPYPNRPLPETAALREEMCQLHDLINRVQRQIVPTIPSPALPTPRTPLWPRQNQGPDLPDGL